MLLSLFKKTKLLTMGKSYREKTESREHALKKDNHKILRPKYKTDVRSAEMEYENYFNRVQHAWTGILNNLVSYEFTFCQIAIWQKVFLCL